MEGGTVFSGACRILGISGFFFFNATATSEIYTLSLHDALPIFTGSPAAWASMKTSGKGWRSGSASSRSEEHTSELQSQFHLVCRLLLEKKKTSGGRIPAV